MNAIASPRPSAVARSVYVLLEPLPFGLFVGGLIFDIVYARTAVVMWNKGAAWLIVLGLLSAVVPRIMQLVTVFITRRRVATGAQRIDFLLRLIAVVVAVFNAFVHSRDAYAVVPEGVWLSTLTVLVLAIARVLATTRLALPEGYVHD